MAKRTTRVGVLISGRGSNMISIARACSESDIPAEVVVVISNEPDAAGLGKAAEMGIETLSISHRDFASREEFDRAIVSELRQRDVDLVCLAGFMRLLSPYFCEAYRNRIFNIHPALLPSFPGLDGQRQALEYGVKISGCTVHFVDEELDHGPIVAQAAVLIGEGDDEDALSARILEHEHRIYPEAVRLFAEGRLVVEGRCVRVLPE
jgi:phosphoribosylglycinamide formyltransferase-1